MIKISKYRMVGANQLYYVFYNRGALIVEDKATRKRVQYRRLYPIYKSARLFQRLLRMEPRTGFFLDSDTIIFSMRGGVYKYDIRSNNLSRIHSFRKGMNNPLSFCLIKDEDGGLKEVYYGEYFGNPSREEVSIFKYDLEKWEKVYTFPPKRVLHIHNVIFDKYSNRFLILTGDSDDESAIWGADRAFKNVKKIVGGKQMFRACQAFSTKKGVYYATDTPLEENYLFLLSNDGSIKEVAVMSGPCIYGRILDGSLYMATSVEGNPNLGGWKYRLSNQLGVGVKDRRVHIMKCDCEGNVSEIGTFKKDIFPMWLFQFGNALLPVTEDGVYIATQSTVEKGTYSIGEGEL